jgi:hypothetical protein
MSDLKKPLEIRRKVREKTLEMLKGRCDGVPAFRQPWREHKKLREGFSYCREPAEPIRDERCIYCLQRGITAG